MSDAANRWGVVLVTAASQTEAESIAHTLIQAKLAACVSLAPIRSIYTWKGEIIQDEEWQLIIKTDLNQFFALAAEVRSIHSYEIPEIIALPIVAGSTHYLQWMENAIGQDHPQERP